MSRFSALVLAPVLVLATSSAAGPARASDPMPWRLLETSAPLPPTLGVPMGVYDAPRHRVLAIDADYSDRPIVVHAFDPGAAPRWSTVATVGTPPSQRYLASIVMDPVRDRLLVFGSYHGQAIDVWGLSLQGTPAWEGLVTSGNPLGRCGHSTIYDPVHDRVVMFGGMDYSSPTRFLSESWSLSLATGAWSEITAGGPMPGGREGHGAVYDPERQRMMVFGGHYESETRGFWNDTWELSLGDTAAWTSITVAGAVPGARSAFGAVYDPIRRRMLVHGGINAQSGIEPDNLWALSLDGSPEWRPIVTTDTLRGRSYPIDVYDPDTDRLLACGGGGYPQTSALSLANLIHWDAVLPPNPLPAPGARSGHAVLYDSRRDRFVVMGGAYSSIDSAVWIFRPAAVHHWQAVRALRAPSMWFDTTYPIASVYDSLADRIIVFDGGQAWSTPAAEPRSWSALGPLAPTDTVRLGVGASVALDTRRNRLIVSGGWLPYAHSAGFTQNGVWALSLGPTPSWSLLGLLPMGSAGHASFYDPVHDRFVILGGWEVNDMPRTRRSFGAVVWASPLETTLQWSRLGAAGDAAVPAPPDAQATFDVRTSRMFIANATSVRTRGVDDSAPWTDLSFATASPTISSAIAYDPVRDQLLALFASLPGTNEIDAWALAVGPMSVSLLGAERSQDAVVLQWRSVTASGRLANVERREESTDWVKIGALEFDVDGLATFTDHDVKTEHDYQYRVAIPDGASAWHSASWFVADPANLRLALFGARPNPAGGSIQVVFSLPSTGPAQFEVFDIRGRQCLSRDVGALGPGVHSVRLEGSEAWRPGVYFARLRRAGDSRTTRMVLMR